MGFAVTNRQVAWAVFAAAAGCFIGGEAGGATGIIIGGAWGGSIGCGIGSLLEQKQPTRWILIYWAATLALFCPLPAILITAMPRPDISTAGVVLAGFVGATAGVLVGLLAGSFHVQRLRRRA